MTGGRSSAGRAGHRRRSLHRRRRRRWLLFKRLGAATASTRCASASAGCVPSATPTSSSRPTRAGSRASPRGPPSCAATAPTCSSTPGGIAAGRHAPTPRASRELVAARPLHKDPANPLLTGNAAWQCPGTAPRSTSGRPGSTCCTTPTVRRRLRPPALRAARPRRLHADGWPTIAGGLGPALTAAAPLGAPGPRRPGSPTASPAAHWRPAGNGRSSPRPTRGPTAERCG